MDKLFSNARIHFIRHERTEKNTCAQGINEKQEVAGKLTASHKEIKV